MDAANAKCINRIKRKITYNRSRSSFGGSSAHFRIRFAHRVTAKVFRGVEMIMLIVLVTGDYVFPLHGLDKNH